MAIRSLFKKKQTEIHEDKRYEHHTSAPHVEEGEGNWLISYADMMTLLCGFFIMMFSLANLEKGKFEKVREEISKHFKGEYQNPSADIQKEISNMIQEAGLDKESIVTSDETGVSVTFESAVFFITGSADVTDNGKLVLGKLTNAIKKSQERKKLNYNVVIEGHTDQRPIIGGIYPSNWELSGARASRIVRQFIDNKFLPVHMLAIGYGDTRPKLTDRTPSGELSEEAMGKNRRVVVRVLHPDIHAIPFSGFKEPSRQNVPVETVPETVR
ncbi:MAG: OmpA family protein [Xanthomonadaceae bacterium]|nr:OmpA family protein [Xanthomonadaceae bacterium]